MPKGNLEKWLYSHNYCLNMIERLNIMIDVASALEYLHHGYSMPIVHSDLKPSNVLLDEDMVAHVSDFGIAKSLCDGDSLVLTNTLATFGYIAPGKEEMIDKNMQCVSSILELALKCSADSLGDRINMKQAHAELRKIKHRFFQ
ncbi:putative L-type lectin-domain containing receptor kinase V.2 [Salvia miltiorrhiza]|uniref:putative L-type lectin-domain containing receptor kinase V.2 n=1 Tax=Salvia miltiorrhiza TaxID=226208 RepID=UPI0025AD48F6|nr:putative L-type lectin-domain containing receptor kinase V.2 [Salvia miltiorrhiza]